MKNQALVRKYAQGLVQAVHEEAEFKSVQRELRAFLDLCDGRKDLREALTSPFVGMERKGNVLAGVLTALKAGEKSSRLLTLLLNNKRLDLLGDIVAALPETWNDKEGILTFEVMSVVPLTDKQTKRLRQELEKIERKPVSLTFRLDPDIVGGLALRRGNIVYDVSIRGNLEAMKEQIERGERST